jgi:hypothetical protein
MHLRGGAIADVVDPGELGPEVVEVASRRTAIEEEVEGADGVDGGRAGRERVLRAGW